MTEPVSIAGGTEPGYQTEAQFPFYRGPVGVRNRGEWLDVSFFAVETMKAKLPTSGLLGDEPVRITAITTRPLDPSVRRGGMQSITVTVVPDLKA